MEKPTPTCKNGQKMIWGATTFEYEENDILVEVSNVPAWICPDCDDVSFPPGVSQQLITSVRELITATRRSKARNVPLYEYHVKAAMEELEKIPNFKNDEEIIAFMEDHSGFELVDQGLAEIVETPTFQKKVKTAVKTGQEQTMTPLTLDPKYVDVFQVFGNLDEIVEKALHRYAIEQINERIEKARQEVLLFENKYGKTYEEFCERAATDEAFLDYLENNHPLWGHDLNTWEFYTEDLAEWLGRLNSISKP